MTMKGIHPSATRLILQLNANPNAIPTTRAKLDSMITAVPSVLAPFSAYTSLARTEFRTPGAFSLLSNQPMFFLTNAP